MAEPEPVTVWMVHLERATVHNDVKGTLSLEDDLLTFEVSSSSTLIVFPFSSITGVKRLRSSPVLLIEWRDEDVRRRTAFYFTQPPPLPVGTRSGDPTAGPPSPERLNPLKVFSSGKRRSMRVNSRYLQEVGISKKELIQLWAVEVGARIGPTS
jgi:hypothetical protein